VPEDFDLKGVLEKTYGLGPIPPGKLSEMKRVLDSVRDVWSSDEATNDEMSLFRSNREKLLETHPLPRAAEAFSFEHNKLGKVSYPSFESKFKKRMAEFVLTLTLDRVRKGNDVDLIGKS